MDSDRFDQLVLSLTTSASRRRLIGLLSAVPIIGGLVSLPGDEATAKGRSPRRREAAHERDFTAEKRKKKKKKKCKPQSTDATCTGKCGAVTNNCKKTVICGNCPICERCNSASNTCQPDPGQLGDACGQTGQICLANGSCACDGGSCGGGKVCLNGTCQDCGFLDAPCCSSNNCVPSPGLGCFAGICEECGGTGEQCCPNDICITGRVCITGTCELCGIAGQPCCSGNACFGGATCDQGTCVA